MDSGCQRGPLISWGDSGSDGLELGTAATEDPSALALGASAPDAVIDAVGQGVLEALGPHRAIGTHAAGPLDADPVRREELRRRPSPARRGLHPVVVGGRLVNDVDTVHVVTPVRLKPRRSSIAGWWEMHTLMDETFQRAPPFPHSLVLRVSWRSTSRSLRVKNGELLTQSRDVRAQRDFDRDQRWAGVVDGALDRLRGRLFAAACREDLHDRAVR